MSVFEELKNIIKGEVVTDEETLKRYSADASIFEVKPMAVVFPKDTEDVKNLVKFVSEKKEQAPELSLTARSGGTDMTGGPLSESIVVEFDKYFNHIKEVAAGYAIVQPGVYYRDFERETLKLGLFFPSYPASKSLCAIGGMIANNAGGEKTLRYGQTNAYVRELSVVLSDGNQYSLKKLDEIELQKKKAQGDFEGQIYRKIYELCEDNFDMIQEAKPKVSKNSSGYSLWNVWDRKYFDLTQLFTGSQGTLGIITQATLGLISKKKYSRLAVVFLKDIEALVGLVKTVLPFHPESLETFDDRTLKLALRFLPDIAKRLGGRGFFSLALEFLGEFFMVLRHGIPKFVVLVEITADEEQDMKDRLQALRGALQKARFLHKIMKSEKAGEKYWAMRRESFNLLRRRIKNKRAAPFIDDIIVPPDTLPEFLPKLYNLLGEYAINPTLAGHAGDGNFHVIPLMDLSYESERQKIFHVAGKVYDLVLRYGGSITAEHNDGLIRSPYLEKMYGSEIYRLFERVKEIFDPKDIFNPGKKVGASVEYAMRHIKTQA